MSDLSAPIGTTVEGPVAEAPVDATVAEDALVRPSRRVAAAVGLALVGISLVIYWLSDRFFDAGRGDLFYLADAFLHGRTWLLFIPGPNDIVVIGSHVYVPFGPFPAILFMPIVALINPFVADQWQTGINAALAAIDVGLCWWLLGRLGVSRLVDRIALTVLLGFSTQIWWVTTRGGVWHTGHLVAIGLTFLILIELWGSRRGFLIGLLAGAAFLTRAPLAFAIPVYALFLLPPGWGPLRGAVIEAAGAVGAVGAVRGAASDRLRRTFRAWVVLGLGVLPAIVFFFWYNQDRFGSPLESGYALATLPDWLAAIRAQGLFSLDHLGMNIDYLFLHLPEVVLGFPFFRPDGLGLSIFITSPGLLYAIRAPFRDRRAQLLLAATVLTLLPNLLYYGGGWLQYGYRYALDAVPFVIALCGLAAARRGRIGWGWYVLIAFGVVFGGLFSVYWAYHL
jgi:hypothetical protein